MKERALPVDPPRLAKLAAEQGTPLYVYDAATIRARLARLAAFDVVRYAQKANSNLALLDLLRRCGASVDAVSAGEIARALKAGFSPERIAFTADVLDPAARRAIAEHPLRIVCGSIDMLPWVAAARPAAAITLRINPGFGHGHDAQVATGGAESKHGIWHRDVPRAVGLARTLGLTVAGLHVHVGSGSDLENLCASIPALERAAAEVGPSLGSISAGGGLPIPYGPYGPRRPDGAHDDGERDFDVDAYYQAWHAARERLGTRLSKRLELEVEPGRFLVAESGVLVTRVLGTKANDDVLFVLTDAGFHTLIRPALYGAWHRIVPLEPRPGARRPTVVAGPLCESGDVFTRDRAGTLEPRLLPPLVPGDLLAIGETGAYGMSMASRYNSQPLPAEVLVDGESSRLVRRRESLDDLWAHELGL